MPQCIGCSVSGGGCFEKRGVGVVGGVGVGVGVSVGVGAFVAAAREVDAGQVCITPAMEVEAEFPKGGAHFLICVKSLKIIFFRVVWG